AEVPDDDASRRLYMDVVRAYRGYIDDGVETLVEAMAGGDYVGFYSVNETYGEPRGQAFIDAIGNFAEYSDNYRQEVLGQIEQNRNLQMIGLGIAILIGLLLVVLARIFLGRTVLRSLSNVSEHFERIAAGDLSTRVEVGDSRNEMTALLQ